MRELAPDLGRQLEALSDVPMVEAGTAELEAEYAENLLRDARSAVWRAGFAARLAAG